MINIIKKRIPTIPKVPDPALKLPVACVTTHAMIPAKMINDVPLVIPFSVIISDIKSITIEPTAITNAANNIVNRDDVSINHVNIELIKNTIPIDCKNARGNVIYLI